MALFHQIKGEPIITDMFSLKAKCCAAEAVSTTKALSPYNDEIYGRDDLGENDDDDFGEGEKDEGGEDDEGEGADRD